MSTMTDIVHINRATDKNRVERLKWLRTYWIQNYKTMEKEEKGVLTLFIFQARHEIDLEKVAKLNKPCLQKTYIVPSNLQKILGVSNEST